MTSAMLIHRVTRSQLAPLAAITHNASAPTSRTQAHPGFGGRALLEACTECTLEATSGALREEGDL